MLANDGAKVFSVDINSIYEFSGGRLHKCNETPESCVKQSSVVVTGVPTKAYRLPTEWIQPNTTVINVASFKNVDEESLLQIPGIVYIPQVGKVTVAMLERNLMRLFEQFHQQQHLYYQKNKKKEITNIPQQTQQTQQPQPWYGHPLHLYTAAVVTALFAMQWMKKP